MRWKNFARGKYRVSTSGVIQSCFRKWKSGKWKTLTQRDNGYGYLYVNRFGKVHHIVLDTFKGPKPKGMVRCHKNGKRKDNRLSNLVYQTQSENLKQMKKHGTLPDRSGNKHPRFIYGERILKGRHSQIRKDYKNLGSRKTARKYNISRCLVGRVIRKSA